MDLLAKIYVFFLCAIAGILALPAISDSQIDFNVDLKYASRLTKLIATGLLKDDMEIDGNNAYSPLGIATLLAVLAEAANGETFIEFVNALQMPKTKCDLRMTFEHILNRIQMQRTESHKNLSFKTWLYIYRNFTVRDEFKQLIVDNYFVDIKDINRSNYDWDTLSTAFETLTETANINNSKDVVGFETLKKIVIENEDTSLTEINKKSAKFGGLIDDKEYDDREVPLIRQSLVQKKCAQNNKIESDIFKKIIETTDSAFKQNEYFNTQNNEIVRGKEKDNMICQNCTNYGKIQSSAPFNDPQKVTIPLQKLVERGKDVTKRVESHFYSKNINRARNLVHKSDLASALSANSLIGNRTNLQTKMLLFNGLYYHDDWENHFHELPNELFYLSTDETIRTPMMYALGKYNVSDLQALNAWAVSIPYKNHRYSLLVIVPKEVEGLRKLIVGFNVDIFSLVKSLYSEKSIYLCLPKFQVEETSRSDPILKSLGLRKVFTPAAELGELSDDSDLYVDEIVQFVNIWVDRSTTSKYGSLAKKSLDEKIENSVEQKVQINRPFLYFILDTAEDFVIVSGKITIPKLQDKINPEFEDEFNQS